jgi:hypothetical protein
MDLEEYFSGVKQRFGQLTDNPALFLAQSLRQALPTQMPGQAQTPEEKEQYLREVMGMFGAGSLKPFGKFLEAQGSMIPNHLAYRGELPKSKETPVEFWTDNPYKALGYAAGMEGSFSPASVMRVAEQPTGPRVLNMNPQKYDDDEWPTWEYLPMAVKDLRRLGYLTKENARSTYNQQKSAHPGLVPALTVSTDNLAKQLMNQQRFDALRIPQIRDWLSTPADYLPRSKGIGGAAHQQEVGYLPESFKDINRWAGDFDKGTEGAAIDLSGYSKAADVFIKKKNSKVPMLEDMIDIDYKAEPKARL